MHQTPKPSRTATSWKKGAVHRAGSPAARAGRAGCPLHRTEPAALPEAAIPASLAASLSSYRRGLFLSGRVSEWAVAAGSWLSLRQQSSRPSGAEPGERPAAPPGREGSWGQAVPSAEPRSEPRRLPESPATRTAGLGQVPAVSPSGQLEVGRTAAAVGRAREAGPGAPAALPVPRPQPTGAAPTAALRLAGVLPGKEKLTNLGQGWRLLRSAAGPGERLRAAASAGGAAPLRSAPPGFGRAPARWLRVPLTLPYSSPAPRPGF